MSLYRDGFCTAADGLKIYYRDYGFETSGAVPVLCLPGLTRNSKDFEELAAHLSRTRRVLCIDFRGRGRSQYAATPDSYTPVHELGDVITMMISAGIARAVFIGTSRGGLVTILAAATRPDLVAGAVLNDIGPEIAAAGLARILAYAGQLPPVADWSEAVAQAKSTSLSQFPTLAEADWQRIARKLYIVRDGRPVLDYDPQIGAASRLGPPPDPDQPPPNLWAPFQGLQNIRTLAIRGALSDILSAETLDKMVAAKPDLTAVTIPGQGHAPFLETPLALNAIEDLLRRVDG